MKEAIVIYQSITGNTKKVAESIHEGLIEGGYESIIKTVQDAAEEDFFDYDLVCFGAPSYNWNVPKQTNDYLKAKFSHYMKSGKILTNAPKTYFSGLWWNNNTAARVSSPFSVSNKLSSSSVSLISKSAFCKRSLTRDFSRKIRNAEVSKSETLIFGIIILSQVFPKRRSIKLSSSCPFNSCVVLPERM